MSAVTTRLADLPSLAPPHRPVVAIGTFDGVHLGHQAVIARAKAAAAGAPLVALTFEPHPRSVLKPDAPVFRLTPAPLRARLLRAAEATHVVTLAFDAELAALDADAFVRRVLVDGLGAAEVVAGYDFHFGRARSGTPGVLRALGAQHGLRVEIVEAFAEAGRPVSSSAIRQALAEGNVSAANAALGWRWFVEGEVVHGDKRGRALGYPTANLVLPPETALAHGVYAVRVRAEGTWWSGAANWGRRVQFGGDEPVLEPYLVGFSGDLYGTTIRVEFCARLRGEERFADVPALVDQMGRDVDAARAAVTAATTGPQGPLQAAAEA
jgi:riboflavin kinase/FMN adenylyltransferase